MQLLKRTLIPISFGKHVRLLNFFHVLSHCKHNLLYILLGFHLMYQHKVWHNYKDGRIKCKFLKISQLRITTWGIRTWSDYRRAFVNSSFLTSRDFFSWLSRDSQLDSGLDLEWTCLTRYFYRYLFHCGLDYILHICPTVMWTPTQVSNLFHPIPDYSRSSLLFSFFHLFINAYQLLYSFWSKESPQNDTANSKFQRLSGTV